jgi:hypothetical protein
MSTSINILIVAACVCVPLAVMAEERDLVYTFWMVAKWLIGDFSIQYIYNQNERQLHHLYFTMAGRLGVKMGNVGTFAPGSGFYFDTPPSNRKYRGGGGLRAPIGFLFNTTFDSRFFVEGNVIYGSYGMGEKSTKLSFGGVSA